MINAPQGVCKGGEGGSCGGNAQSRDGCSRDVGCLFGLLVLLYVTVRVHLFMPPSWEAAWMPAALLLLICGAAVRAQLGRPRIPPIRSFRSTPIPAKQGLSAANGISRPCSQRPLRFA